MMTTGSPVQEGRIPSILPMIVKAAKTAYTKLPTSQKLGITVEDLVEEGKLVVIQKAAVSFDPKRHVKFSTFAQLLLNNYFTDRVRSAYYACNCACLYSSDTTVVKAASSGKQLLLRDFVAKSRHDFCVEERIISRIDAERAFLKAYNAATPKLRQYLINWLLQPKPTSYKQGVAMRVAMAYMRSSPHLDKRICHTVMHDHECRRNIAKKLTTFTTPLKGAVVETSVQPILVP